MARRKVKFSKLQIVSPLQNITVVSYSEILRAWLVNRGNGSCFTFTRWFAVQRRAERTEVQWIVFVVGCCKETRLQLRTGYSIDGESKFGFPWWQFIILVGWTEVDFGLRITISICAILISLNCRDLNIFLIRSLTWSRKEVLAAENAGVCLTGIQLITFTEVEERNKRWTEEAKHSLETGSAALLEDSRQTNTRRKIDGKKF